MYFGSPVAGPFTVGDSVFKSLILCLKVKNKQKKKNQSRGHFLAPLKPDAVLHSLKPQSTLQRGRHETIKAASLGGKKKKCITWTQGESTTPLHAASLSDEAILKPLIKNSPCHSTSQ